MMPRSTLRVLCSSLTPSQATVGFSYIYLGNHAYVSKRYNSQGF